MSNRIGATASLPGGAAPAQPGLGERALEVSATLKESLLQGTKAIREYIVKEPARAIGLALGVGVLLGWLIKRR
jgi:ElaB/YqjD/DUF883 family membrane-anchored ribosome-binding protein